MDLHDIYQLIAVDYLGDPKKIIECLREAEYILPKHISPSVSEIYKSYDTVCSRFIALGTLSKISLLSKEEISDTKQINLVKIIEELKNIESKVPFIQSIMPPELDISELDR